MHWAYCCRCRTAELVQREPAYVQLDSLVKTIEIIVDLLYDELNHCLLWSVKSV